MKRSMLALIEDVLLGILAIAAVPTAAFVSVSLIVGRYAGDLLPSVGLGLMAAVAALVSTLNALWKQRGVVYRTFELLTKLMLWMTNGDDARTMWRSAIYGSGSVVAFALAIIIPNNL